MRIASFALFLTLWLPAQLFAQSSPIILQMETEHLPGTDELLAHLRVLEFDSMIAYHLGLKWDTAKVDYLAVEDQGPLGVHGSYGVGIQDVQLGYFQNLWYHPVLACTHLDEGKVIFSLRFREKQPGALFTLLADTFVHVIGSHGISFETIGCDGKLKDVIYINNGGDTMIVQNGVLLDLDQHGAWPELALFPNPASDHLQVHGLGSLGGEWTLLDPLGRPLRQGPYTTDRLTLPLQGLAPGQYFLRLQGQDRRHTVRSLSITGN